MSSSDRLWKITCCVDLWSTPTKLYQTATSNRMQYLMEQFETAFDLVIYDTPHLGLADTNFMAAHTDGILMVIKSGKTRSEVMHVLNG